MPDQIKVVLKEEVSALIKKFETLKIKPTVAAEKFALALKSINPNALVPIEKLPEDVQATLKSLDTKTKRFHGAKISLSWFPFPKVFSPCADKFGYLTSATVRASSKLDFNVVNVNLLNQLGALMAAAGREPANADSNIPSGYTYFGQFVDHDITLDVSSTIDTANDATAINNMRSPRLDLDNVYGSGPATMPYMYEFPSGGNGSAVKFKLGTNTPTGPGGPGGNTSTMAVQTNYDVPRMSGTNTAVIGDPRNDENLIVAQFQSAMLKFHNAVVDLVVASGFSGDVFTEAKKIVTHHYQFAVINDYLVRICGQAAVTNALSSVAAPINSAFSMPVEFSVGAYRFGHSMIRESYWVNFGLINQPLSDIFSFVRNPNLPVFSNWAVDFNAFFDTTVPVPVHNKARKIDSVLSVGLNALPGGAGIMAQLATRNLRRGLAFGLPSGQAAATSMGIMPMTSAQLTSGLPADELALLNSAGGLLLTKTPLWYYILREAMVLNGGNSLGPLGAKIVAETFVRMLKRDSESYINKSGGFTPFLPSLVPNTFTVADLVIFAGVTQP